MGLIKRAVRAHGRMVWPLADPSDPARHNYFETVASFFWASTDHAEAVEDLLAAHPRLTREAIQAALAFAAEALKADVIYPAPGEAA